MPGTSAGGAGRIFIGCLNNSPKLARNVAPPSRRQASRMLALHYSLLSALDKRRATGYATPNLSQRRHRMARPVTLFTGQWADLPLETLAQKASAWGFDGLELA